MTGCVLRAEGQGLLTGTMPQGHSHRGGIEKGRGSAHGQLSPASSSSLWPAGCS
jgi:hypothetical protein